MYVRVSVQIEGTSQCYFPLQAMITLLKPTKTPLFGLLEKKGRHGRFLSVTRQRCLSLLPLKQALSLVDAIVFAL